MDLVVCPECRRHVRAGEERCPFCNEARVGLGRFTRAAISAGVAATASVTLAACYGAPPRHYPDRPPPGRTSWEHPTENAVGFVDDVERGARAAGCTVAREEPHLGVRCEGQPDLRLTTLSGYVRIQCGDASREVCERAVERLLSPPSPSGSSSVPPMNTIAPPQ